ncbi:MAG: type VII secretion protein EccB [Actinoplanes sp.]
MPSRQDQLHSYQYSLQRVVAALVTHDPDPQRSPLRRAGTTALVSLLIATLAVVGAAIYGIFTGQSNTNPRDPNVVFQEKGSGARFVYLTADQRLHPVLNYSSGLLLANAPKPELKSISTERLAEVQLGAPLGIPDAPDSLPDTDALLTERWSVCTDNQAAGGRPRTTLLVGHRLTDGTVAAKTGTALLVQDPPGRTYLVHANRRFPIPADRVVATKRALGWNDVQPWPVSIAWLNAVPLGRNLTAPQLPAAGGVSPATGRPIGQLVARSGRQFAVILADGSASVTEMQAKLLQAAGVNPVEIGDAFIGLPESKTTLTDSNDPNGLPSTVPPLTDNRPGVVCMTLPVDTRSGDGIRINPSVPTGLPVGGGPVASGANLADLVYLKRGKGVVAVAAASPSAPPGTGTVSVITDTGLRFPLASRDLLAKLGYGDVKPRPIPTELITLLPDGPALDPARARQTSPQ